jgi:hypothetical protein
MGDAIDAEVLEVYFPWLKIYADKHYCPEDLLARIAPGSILRVGHSRNGGLIMKLLLHYFITGHIPKVPYLVLPSAYPPSLLIIPRTVFDDCADQICSRRR